MLTDVVALAMAFLAALWAGRPATSSRSFGLYRVEVLAALINGIILLFVVFEIGHEALERFQEPPNVNAGLLLGVATVGLLVNITSAFVLAGGRHTNLNVRAAFLHIMGDLFGSVAVIIGGLVILKTGYDRIDAIMSFVVAALVLVSAIRLIRDAVHVLLEGAPVDVAEVASALGAVATVESVHDIHVWSLTPGVAAMTAHLVVTGDKSTNTDKLLDDCKHLLDEEFGIKHATLQIERKDLCTTEEIQNGCALATIAPGTDTPAS